MISTLLAVAWALPLSVNAARMPTTNGDAGWLAGVWKGSSICQIKESPCHDEVVVYYVTEEPEHEVFQIKMNKVVNGADETMGVLDCKAAPARDALDCRPNDCTTWSLKLDKDVLNGTLLYKGQLYRKIRMTRAQ